MATRQYIGARYVPKFYDYNGSSNWRAGVEYENLTIVTRNGNSYTSKKPVPSNIGEPENNPEYWVSTGIYNEQVESYRQITQAVASRVEEVTADVTDEATARENADAGLNTAIENEATARENADNAIIEAMKTDSLRRYVFIGDSYLQMNPSRHTYAQRACNILNATIGETAWQFAAGGAGFVGAGQGKTFLDILETAHTSLLNIADEITDVIICGGANDAHTTYPTQAINTAKSQFIDTAKSYFKNARIFISCIAGFQNYDQNSDVLKRIKWIYEYPGANNVIPISNGWIPMQLNACHSGDAVHPNAAGVDGIANIIGTAVKAISGVGSLTAYNLGQFQIDPASDVASMSTGLYYIANSFGIRVFAPELNVTFNSDKNITYNLGVDLLLGSTARGNAGLVGLNNPSAPLSSPLAVIPCTINALSGSTTWVANHGTLAFIYDASTGAIELHVIASTGNGGASITTRNFRITGIDGFVTF